MHVCLVINSLVPAPLYGGTERVVVWLARGLHQLGHRVTCLARAGSRCEVAQMRTLAPGLPIDKQIPADADIVHAHALGFETHGFPFCQTLHGNMGWPAALHPNTIFVAAKHAHNHGAEFFVHNGLDPADYGLPDLARPGQNLIFLAKAAWRVKNVRGAIRVARQAGVPLDVLGGTRLNFKMGFRLTLDSRVRFHGMVGGEKKNALLRQARGLISPVLWEEPFGIAVIEALYFGLPVFGTPYGSLPELVPAEAGFLSNSESALAEAVANNRYDRRAVHAWWNQHFTHLQMAKKYLHCYERILGGETLHPSEIHSPAVRTPNLLAWNR
jgi:glycosyltransferase involved in cell wall biosynthesis